MSEQSTPTKREWMDDWASGEYRDLDYVEGTHAMDGGRNMAPHLAATIALIDSRARRTRHPGDTDRHTPDRRGGLCCLQSQYTVFVPKEMLRLGHLRDFGRDKAVKRETTLSRNERHRIAPEGAK
jgi:hypothetical protein